MGGGHHAHLAHDRTIRMNNIIRELRAERGWSQAVLGEKLNVSRQSVIAIETGRYDPSLPLAFRIARVLERPIEEIFQFDPEA